MAIARSRSAVLAVLAVGLFFLTGCGRINKENFAAIKLGMTKAEVEKVLGSDGKLMTKEALEELPSFQIKPKNKGMGGPGGEEAPKDNADHPEWYLWGDTNRYILVGFRKDNSGELKVSNTTSNGL